MNASRRHGRTGSFSTTAQDADPEQPEGTDNGKLLARLARQTYVKVIVAVARICCTR